MGSELRVGREKIRTASSAGVYPRLCGVDVLARPGGFGAGLSKDVKLLRTQQRAPLILAQSDKSAGIGRNGVIAVWVRPLMIHAHTLGAP